MSSDQTISLLKIMTESCKDTSFLDADSLLVVTKLALDELQGNAYDQSSKFLVALSKAHCNHVMNDIFARYICLKLSYRGS